MHEHGRRTEVPICRSLFDELITFAHARGSTEPHDPGLRVDQLDRTTGTQRPLTDDHFDTLHVKIREHLPLARGEGETVHWALRHAKAEMHNIGRTAVARRFMGHSRA